MSPDNFQQDNNDMPMIEIFGGLFALLLVLLVIISLLSSINLEKKMEDFDSGGEFSVGFDNNSEGFVVLSYPGGLYVPSLQQQLTLRSICQSGSAFVSFAKSIYQQKKQQLIFAIVEGGVDTMAVARQCLMKIMPQRKMTIGWIIADDELLKSLTVGDIPPHIKRVVDAKSE